MLRIALMLTLIFLSSCATTNRGYFQDVPLINSPEGLKIHTPEGVEIAIEPGETKTYTIFEVDKDTGKRKYKKKVHRQEYKIRLKSQSEHVLIFEYNGQKKTIKVYGRISYNFLILDTLMGIFPIFIDAYTENWYNLPPIQVEEWQ